MDIRPRYFDKAAKKWYLLDTGAQVSCCPPSPEDRLDPSVLLEAVDGSKMPCYGKKQLSIQIGRKMYHQTVFITNTSETILGMDFVLKNRMDFRWGEFGDYYMYDTKAKISGLLQFVKIPKNALPRVSKVNVISSTPTLTPSGPPNPPLPTEDPDWAHFQVNAIQTAQPEKAKKAAQKIHPKEYLDMVKEFPCLLKPDFRNIKHSVEHSIETEGPPIRSKVRPLLPGSRKRWQERPPGTKWWNWAL